MNGWRNINTPTINLINFLDENHVLGIQMFFQIKLNTKNIRTFVPLFKTINEQTNQSEWEEEKENQSL